MNDAPSLALIIGASSGFGQAAARMLAAQGWRVIGTSRKAEAAELVQAGQVTMMPVDVADDASVETLRAHLAGLGLCPDLVVISAGIGIAGPIEETPVAVAKSQFETNFFGAHRIVRAFLPMMRARGQGKFVLIGSIAGEISIPFQGFYSASKFALRAYAEALRHEVAAHGIWVSLVEPGDHKTGFGDSRPEVPASPGYDPIAARALSIQFESEDKGPGPDPVAKAVLKIAGQASPPLRVLVGSSFEVAMARLKQFVPDSWFAAIVSSTFKLREE